MKKLLLFLALFVLYTAAPFAQAEHWTPMNSTETGSYFFNSETIRVQDWHADSGKIYVDVWIKVKHTFQGKTRYINSLKDKGGSAAGYERLDFSTYHVLFGDGEMMVLTVCDHAGNGAKIMQLNVKEPKWEEIATGSIAAGWYRSILEYTAANIHRIIHQDIRI